MENQSHHSPSDSLPIERDLKPASLLTIILAVLMTAASLGGLFFPSSIYLTDELRLAFLANDVVNLLIGLPIALGSLWLTRRGKLIGLLCWPGALLYTFYNYLVYLVGIPLGLITSVFLTLVLLSAYLMIDLLRTIDRNAVQAQLKGAVPEKLSGGILAFFGVAFFTLAAGVINEARTSQTTLPMTEVGLAIADMSLSVLLVIGGVLLFQRKPLGYVSGLGLLLTASTLFIGLLLVLILQPALMGVPFQVEDVAIVLAMGLICFVPTGLFMWGVLSKND